MASKLQVDVYYSFRSPYSYLASSRLAAIAKTYNVDLRLRPVFPLIVRSPDFFVNSNRLLPKYIGATDCPRIAKYLNIPYQWPKPDPVRIKKDANGRNKMAEDQPHIYRLTYMGIVAQERGKGIQFAYEVSRIIWTTDNWDKGSLLADAVRRAGLDLAELDKVARADEERLEKIAAENLSTLEAAGHWGVPTCVFQGEPFFGQDRLDLLMWRLKQNGLREKAKLS